MRSWLTVCGVALLAAGCIKDVIKEEWVDAKEPTQGSEAHPMTARGGVAFEQRQRDCWDMPNAQACYDVGLNYELGLAGKADSEAALEYYEKACELDKKDEHCKAAKRMRAKGD